MPKFLYQAKNAAGVIKSGAVDATNENDARLKIKALKMEPVKLLSTGGSQSNFNFADLFKAKSIPPKELQVFTRQLATLINAGIPVVDGLRILINGTRPGVLKDALERVKADIETGKRFSTALASHPEVFDRLYCNLVEAGEEAGILDQILTRLSTYIEKNHKIKSQVKGAMVMPIVIILFAALVITGILIFVIPKLKEVFEAGGGELPWLTQKVIDLSEDIKTNWYIYLASGVGGPYAFMAYIKTEEGKKIFDRFIIRAPLFGTLVLRSSVARVTRTLSTLLSSGVGLIESIEIAARTSGNYAIEEALL
ncbi:MAG: type II secretion system F family protein, partial [Bdellovibrionales bacterium]